jgi:predicted DsbA family dithiol-disulfide isomerase
MKRFRVDPSSSPLAFSGPFSKLVLLVLVLGPVLAACADDRTATAQPPGAGYSGEDVPEVLATVDGEPVTLADIEERIGDELARLEIQYRRSRISAIERALESVLEERVVIAEARAQGRTVDELIQEEAGGELEPSVAEVATWYAGNYSRLGGRSLEELRPQIVEHLKEERRQEALTRLQERLGETREVTIHLEPFRFALDNSRAPALGPADAPVTLVEFSDFQCPFCQRFAPTLEALESEFGDQLRIVYRHFPLTSIHPHAFKAAEASMCAHDQGSFWEYHDLIFQEPDRVTVPDLKEKAGRIGLDQDRFDRCLDAGQHAELVQADFDEGQRAGVTGTPALFVNGIRVPGGAVPFEVVAEAIRKELDRRGG